MEQEERAQLIYYTWAAEGDDKAKSQDYRNKKQGRVQVQAGGTCACTLLLPPVFT